MTQPSQARPAKPGQASQASSPTIEVLYFEGCPNHEHPVALVKRALPAEQIAAPIQLIRVETDAEAQRYGFYGSPSIRINGADLAPLPAGAPPRLPCRPSALPDPPPPPLPT